MLNKIDKTNILVYLDGEQNYYFLTRNNVIKFE